VTCSNGFGFVAFRYWAGTGLSKTMPRANTTSMPLLIQRRFDSLIGDFIAEDVFVNLSKLDGGVIHGRPMAIDSPPSLRSRSSLLAPQHTTPVYVNDRRRYSMFRAVVRDSFPTRLYSRGSHQ
jgi:hypothetical protein